MAVTRIFDWLFVNHLFRANERGETIFYPNGFLARGYLVPPEREPGVRAGLRWLMFAALVGSYGLVVLVPRMIEWWLGFTLPLGWFIGGAVVVTVVIVAAIIHRLERLKVGLEPVSR